MRVKALGVESGVIRPVLLLQEASGDHRLLPVWIGIAEANAIRVEQQRVALPRPMTHQLIGDVLDAFGRELQQVRITELRDNIFHAELILDRNTRVSARDSDAIALALHLGVPIHAEDTVLDAAASRTPRSAQRATMAQPMTSRSSAASSTLPHPKTSTRTRACPADHRTGSRSQILIEARSMVPRNV
jgi:uncharacterized protein